MEKTSNFVRDPSVKGIMERLRIHMNKLPEDLNEEPTNDVPPPQPLHVESTNDVPPPQHLDEEPTNDVPPPQPFVIDLCFHNEDMEVLKQKYKVLSSSSSFTNDDYLKKLGFQCCGPTLMRIRAKNVHPPGKILHVLARSCFTKLIKKHEGIHWMVSLRKSLCASMERDKGKKKVNVDTREHLAAKKLLEEFVMQAKARTMVVRKMGKKKVCFAISLHGGIKKKKRTPRRRSLKQIMITDKEHDA